MNSQNSWVEVLHGLVIFRNRSLMNKIPVDSGQVIYAIRITERSREYAKTYNI
jgi:hypothetical protein